MRHRQTIARRRRAWWLPLLLLCLPALSPAQYDLGGYLLGPAQGLPAAPIYAIAQDSLGYVVVGHGAGLSRFNGHRFATHDSPLAEAAVSGLTALGGDSLLARSFSGQPLLATRDGILHPLGHDFLRPGFPSFVGGHGMLLAHWHDLVLRIGPHGKVDAVVDGRGRLRVYGLAIEPTGSAIGFVHLGNQGCAIVRISPEEGRMDTLLRMDMEARAKMVNVSGKVDVLLPEIGKVYRVGPNSIEELRSPLPIGVKVTDVLALGDSLVAVATYGGLWLADADWKPKGHFLQDYEVSCLHADREGNVWLGTLQDGIVVIPRLDVRTLDLEQAQGRRTRIAASEPLPRGGMVLGTFDGRLLWLDAEGRLERVSDLGRVAEVQALARDSAHGRVLAFCDGLYGIDLASGRVEGPWEVTSTKVIVPQGDRIWCGTSRGLHLLSGGRWQGFLPASWITDMALDDAGKLLLATRTGLRRFDPDELRELPAPVSPGLVEVGAVTRLRRLPGGQVILLDPAHGCHRWSHGRMEALPLPPLHRDMDVVDMAWVDGGPILLSPSALWVSGSDATTWRRIDATKGVLAQDLQQVHVEQGPAGPRLIAVGHRNLLRLPPSLPTNPVTPQLQVRRMMGSYVPDAAGWASEFEGNHFQLTIDLLPGVSARGASWVEYRLDEGQDWQALARAEDGSFVLGLDRLPAGRHRLSLRGRNEDGLPSATLEYELRVHAPYYATAWFMALAVLGVCGIVLAVMWWRLRAANRRAQARLKEAQLKMQAVSAELKAIRSQMNPHFIFNSLSSIQAKVLENDGIAAFDHLSTFSKLLRSVLDHSAREYLTLEEEMAFLRNYLSLEAARIQGQLRYSITVDPALEEEGHRIPTLITQPFVENALRHGLLHKEGEKRLEIAVTPAGRGGLSIRIRDNGIGRKASAELNAQQPGRHRSFAVEAMTQRIAFIRESGGPRVVIETRDLPEGTEVEIRIDHA